MSAALLSASSTAANATIPGSATTGNGVAAARATVTQVTGAIVQLGPAAAAPRASTITLHLAPPALGHVAIRISAPHSASAVVTITASHQASADALATARPGLEASLLRAGLPPDTRIIIHTPGEPPTSGGSPDRGSRQPGGQPRRPTLPARTETELDFAETLDISA